MQRLLAARGSDKARMAMSCRRSLSSNIKEFKTIMAANRGEIATRVFRAGTELNMRTVGIFSMEDKHSLHRFKADESYLIGNRPEFGKNLTPVGKYLNIEEIIAVAKENNVDAIHPGYGFLAEKAEFVRACEEAGIVFIGPRAETVDSLGDKTAARKVATSINVPIIPGTPDAIQTFSEAKKFCDEYGYPVMLKASFGGGGRGMRVVKCEGELENAFTTAQSEALAAFGNGSIFIERYVQGARHIEMQMLGDNYGNVVHLFERDCSLQRRHQKVVEVAPAQSLPQNIREEIADYAVKLCTHMNYRNAGTVEFLVDDQHRPHFIEVNPRLQVEHTVTEEITGIDIVQNQIKIAEGHSLEDLGLRQEAIAVRGAAIQCRVTTEDPNNNFIPDIGTVEAFRTGTGMGIRLDGNGYKGGQVTEHYDSLLVKITARGKDHEDAAAKLRRSLCEFRVRGVKTNVPFVQKMLNDRKFLAGEIDTNYINDHIAQMHVKEGRNRGQKLLNYLGHLAVNGPLTQLGTKQRARRGVEPPIPDFGQRASGKPYAKSIEHEYSDGKNFKYLLDKEGPAAFAKAVRNHAGVLLTDTTFRDAHQSLLATRVRTKDLLAIAPAFSAGLSSAFSMEVWGGATFDVSLNFLRECPFERLRKLREAIPNVPFQMLLRGANAVGYTSYPDNVVFDFCKMARDAGVDVFRIFDSLNYLPNMELGMNAVRAANGVVEAAISYTGDVSNPDKRKYDLDYYLRKVEELEKIGMDVLAIKDMAGLLKPRAATMLVDAIRKEFPDMPIHVHTHDTSGNGVAAMLAAASAGADVVDVAVDSMSGMTSQPSMGAVIAALEGTPLDTGIRLDQASALSDYWENAREFYAPFECTATMKTGSAEVYKHEIPGGQYTNLLFQSHQLGLASHWKGIKDKYAEANEILGDIVKVTPSSKVVGDLANWMVQNEVSKDNILQKLDDGLSPPASLVGYMAGNLGEPEGGFPSPLREKVLGDKAPVSGRPGASMAPVDMLHAKRDLMEKHRDEEFDDYDVMSSVLYPKVFDEYVVFKRQFGDVSALPTVNYFEPPKVGEEITLDIDKGKTLSVVLKAVGDKNSAGMREVFFELNGMPRSVHIRDTNKVKGEEAVKERERADPAVKGSMGAPMRGKVVKVGVKVGDVVKKGSALATLSAMKMENNLSSPIAGIVKKVAAIEGESLNSGDLVVEIEPAAEQ